jgi:hypothetical protein
MKLFYRINLLGLILGLAFSLFIDFIFMEYMLQQKLNLSDRAFGLLTIAFFLILFIPVSLVTPFAIIKWLKGSMWSLILIVLWLPYSIICATIIPKLLPIASYLPDDNYVAGFIIIMGLIVYPIYILILTTIGIGLGKATAVSNQLKPSS